MNRKYQFVSLFPEWLGFYCFRWHKEATNIAYVYDWFLGFGFWEIRKRHHLTEEEKMKLGEEVSDNIC